MVGPNTSVPLFGDRVMQILTTWIESVVGQLYHAWAAGDTCAGG